MKKFTIKIKTDNSAFENYAEFEIHRILKEVLNKLESFEYPKKYKKSNSFIYSDSLLDINGNIVGEVKINY